MAEIVLFHHAQGLTPGVISFADELRADGHAVHTPDLFEGKTFTSTPDGVSHAQEIGFDTVIERGVAAAQELPEQLVYAGMSMGAMPAQKLAQTRAGARGVVLLYSTVPPSYFGEWPEGLPVQIHAKDADPSFVDEGDIEAARELVDTAGAELFLYPGPEHLFADATSGDYDAAAAALATERIKAFLTGLG
jgi:dienelactone hydrolase